ncbi:chromate transporter [Ktedonospora formicarum]|uniref:Chromate transporter n=1 Tax=Ktedonospora formicarum TaxID=2778364 RepID=A0A8J3I1P4_9CHLR|nr:chromate transporter [Ktedonospora formicarum]GHO44617.1 hypothetical protein KSX_27800 [Ktedonospora formicarum]
MQTQTPPASSTRPPSIQPSNWKLLGLWSLIGLQSFGGGSSTTFLIQSTFIDKHHYITMEEYAHFWNLCVFNPGINLIGMTVLIGRKLGGTWGIVVSLTGLLLPSAGVTCLLTALFSSIQDNPVVQAVMRGVVPATAGLMLLVGARFAQPLLQQAHTEGWKTLLICSSLIIICAITIIVLQISVIPVLVGTALISMLIFTSWRGKPDEVARQAGNSEGPLKKEGR